MLKETISVFLLNNPMDLSRRSNTYSLESEEFDCKSSLQHQSAKISGPGPLGLPSLNPVLIGLSVAIKKVL